MNAVFYRDQHQKQQALKSRASMQAKPGRKMHSGVLPRHSFKQAEDYHQKYPLKHRMDLVCDTKRIYVLI